MRGHVSLPDKGIRENQIVIGFKMIFGYFQLRTLSLYIFAKNYVIINNTNRFETITENINSLF